MKGLRPALVGIAGPHLLPDERTRLQALRPAGLLLFARNAIDRAQLTACIADARAALAEVGVEHAIVAVDQEGGAVAPLDRVVDAGPSAASLGWIDDPAFTREVHAERAHALRALGVDLVLAPVADVDRPGNPVIATRAFGGDAALVGRHVEAAVRGLAAGGVRSCAKHWPGHGAPRADSHLELPVLELSEDERLRFDAPPFAAAARAGVDAMMLAHLQVPAWSEAAAHPLGTDPDAVRRLREETGFEGPLLSDAVEMRGLAGRRPLQLLEAGIDLVLFARPVLELGEEATELPLRPTGWPSLHGREPEASRRDEDASRGGGPWTESMLERMTRRRGDPGLLRRAERTWVLDAASGDRLLRLPVAGQGVLEGGLPLDPAVWTGMLKATEPRVLPLAELDRESAPPWTACDALVILAVRPLAPAVEAWIATGARPSALLRLGACALHRGADAASAFELLCPEIRPAALARILGSL